MVCSDSDQVLGLDKHPSEPQNGNFKFRLLQEKGMYEMSFFLQVI